jgi:DNA-binding transcriptional ArsR family regulator
MQEFMRVAKALADENRVRALMLLRNGELCLCQIIEMLGLSPSTVSKHMAVLLQSGLVECRKGGRWHYYRVAETSSSRAVNKSLRWLNDTLSRDSSIARDARKLKTVVKIDRELLCKHYKN